MSVDAYETSHADAYPQELYQWAHAAERYRYTSADDDITFLGETYHSAAIQRGTVAQGDEINRAALEVTVPQDNSAAALYRLGPPVDRVLLTVWRQHVGDTAYSVLWQGRVLSCEWQGITAVLRHEPVWTAVRRQGLRRTWGLSCPYVLYSDACGVTAADVAGTVSAVDGVTVTVSAASAYADGYFAGGVLTREDLSTGRHYRGMILAHTGSTLTLHYPIALVADDAVTLHAGCDHTFATCRDKFANAINFGGFPWTPQNSPYGGTVVF